jgi:L-alanine-DL-glutamate epimerase-like enolase superfamily enzyme
MRTQVLEAAVDFVTQPFLRPLQLSSGIISAITEARARVVVRVNGREASGRGSIYLSDLWAWPEPSLSHQQRDKVLRDYSVGIAGALPQACGEAAHPLELGLRLHEYLHHVDTTRATFSLPLLARAMCASPFDAAIHDAAGHALVRSAFEFYEDNCPIPTADKLFPGRGACAAIHGVLRSAQKVLDAWWIIGQHDSLAEEVMPAIREHGYRCFKLKLTGRDNEADVARTIEVFRAVSQELVAPRLSVDSNEANPDAASVLEYLEQLQKQDANAFAALEYLEQPTGRDITRHAFDWSSVTKQKPVLLDEGLTSFELMELAVRQGWSGFALKTCKGHSFTLVAAAWAIQHGMMLTLQDLTNPGLAAIHAALVAAHIPTRNGIELNSPQFTPAANIPWQPRLDNLFVPDRGMHRVDFTDAIGLGSRV